MAIRGAGPRRARLFAARFPAAWLIFTIAVCPLTSRAGDILVAVASNFRNTMGEIAAAYQKQSGIRIRIAAGSTGQLYAQARHGAPYDAFFAADAERPIRLGCGNPAVEQSRFTYARGRLALWDPDSSPAAEGGIREFLAGNYFKRLAMANPKLAPYGVAARQVLAHLDLTDSLGTKLVYGENIGQTYQFVRSRAAQAGFVAYSQVLHNRQPRTSYLVVPDNLYDPIEQQAVLLTKNPAAADFMDFVRGPRARAIIRRYGYGTGGGKGDNRTPPSRYCPAGGASAKGAEGR